MKKRIISSLLGTAIIAALIAPAAIAADLNDVGYIDQTALGSLPQFASANAQLAQYKAGLDKQFAAAMKSARTDADKQNVTIRFQQQLQDKQRELVGPLFQRAQLALATVAGNRKLSIVVDKRIIVYGGQDVTGDVINAIRSSQALNPPSASPPPSEIGFVDQSALDNSTKVKNANDELQKYMDQQRPAFQQKLKAAKTDAEKNDVGAQFDKLMSDKRDQLLKPLVDQTKAATASVAKSKSLLLVIDRGDVIYGGTDITQDVQSALNK
jgi:outer membrane protein